MRNSTGQDIDRPHYYSQFWLDVAEGKPAGQSTTETAPEAPSVRHQAATAIPEEDFDQGQPFAMEQEPEAAEPLTPVAPVAPVRKPAKQEKKKEEPARVTSLSELARIQALMDSSAEMEDTEAPNLDDSEPEILTDFALGDDTEAPEFAAEDEAEEGLNDEDFEDFEEEEEDEWGGGARKPRKPTKPPRRERPGRF